MLNQLARYEPVVALVEETRGATVLEAGSGSRGIARFLSPRWAVTATDVDFSDYGAVTAEEDRRAERVRADVLRLPFEERSFDVVVAVDLLEHIAPSDRGRALTELVRVSAGRLIVAVPCGSAALEADRRLARFYERRQLPVPTWLAEHVEHGLPERAELERELDPHGRLRLVSNERVSLHERIAKLEALPRAGRISPLLSRVLEAGARRPRRPGARLAAVVLRALRGWDKEPSYRTIAVLDRDHGA